MVTLKTPTWGTSQTLRLFYELVQETETEKLKAGKKNCAEVVTFPPYQEKLPTLAPSGMHFGSLATRSATPTGLEA